eukprot:366444-Chlamydomonas_euryale.AAC.15
METFQITVSDTSRKHGPSPTMLTARSLTRPPQLPFAARNPVLKSRLAGWGRYRVAQDTCSGVFLLCQRPARYLVPSVLLRSTKGNRSESESESQGADPQRVCLCEACARGENQRRKEATTTAEGITSMGGGSSHRPTQRRVSIPEP